MTELYTEALVLEKAKRGDLDSLVTLYSKNFGKVRAFVKSARKITSKLSPHLEPGTFVRVRLIQGEKRNGSFQVADALSEGRIKDKELMKLLEFAGQMIGEGEADLRLWQALKLLIQEKRHDKAAYQLLLQILGFDSKEASCNRCRKKQVDYFVTDEVLFLCKQCGNAMNIPDERMVSI